MSIGHHRSEAEQLLWRAQGADADAAAGIAARAAVHELAAVEGRLGQLVDMAPAGLGVFDRLARALELNAVIYADLTGLGYAPGPEQDAARDWIRDRIADIVSRT